MDFDKKIFDAMQESVQVWNQKGEKLFCNNKASKLYELEDEKIKTIEDVLEKWDFFDKDNKPLHLKSLPAFKVVQSKKAIHDVTLKMMSKDQIKWIKTSVNPILSTNSEVECIITTCLDITSLKNEELKYKKIATYDHLTKLPNRLLLSDRLDLATTHAVRTNTSMAVCMIDLDGFKALNDTHGHDAGDTLLIEVSKRMKEVVRSDDTVARLGGDEFVVILSDLAKSEDCAVTLYRLLNTISAPYIIDGKTIDTISASIGVSLYPEDKVEAEILLRHADVAMYKSKNSGKNKFSFFDIAADQKIKANHKALNKIKTALQNNDFALYYQPKINSISGEIVEVEALARWIHPLLGIMHPNEFLPLIQSDNELSDMFDNWVINQAIKQLLAWHNEGLFVKICINISPKQFKQKDFVEKVTQQFKDNEVSLDLLHHLEFEILETDVVENLSRSNDIVKECKALGLTFALDDFGTGYSSLMHLKELNIDTIKIDRSFVSNMLENSEDLAIVQSITALASAFDITVTAEGAENIEQVVSLMEMGCDEIQGFAIARPMKASEVGEFIANFSSDPRWKLATQTLPSKMDFELLLAESNHKNWFENVINGLKHPSPNAHNIEFDHTQCRFGKWFERIKHKTHARSKSFKRLEQIHVQIHEMVTQLFETAQHQQRAIKEQEIKKLQAMSSELIGLLDIIRNEVEKIKKQQSVVNKILEKRKIYGR